jgi:glycosyltransferase involved in cell wall biosynthesis
VKSILRPLLQKFAYIHYRLLRKGKVEKNALGEALKPGITAVVAAKNEEYTIRLCLRSLVGIADQVVCIDNGSTDGTLKEMELFRSEFGNTLEVDILHMPEALLGDCREAGLKATRYQWHLRWDADMVCKTSGPENMKELRSRALSRKTPAALQLPRTNLIGDLHHTSKLYSVVDPGEPILVWFNRDICYREFGKFDTIRIPFYYKQVKETKKYYFHCEGLKSLDNLMHRYHYFSWREKVNDPKTRSTESFEDFKNRRNTELFGTTDKRSLKYRYMKQQVLLYTPYLPEVYGEYPEILREEMNSGRERFRITYEKGRPAWRIDYKDSEMLGYSPTEEDLSWDPVSFLRRFLTPEQMQKILS